MRLSQERKEAFLENYYKTGNFSKSAWLSGVAKTTVLRELERNETLKKAYEEIEQYHLDRCEEVLQNQVENDNTASITPAIFMLKSKRRNIYGDKTEIDFTGRMNVNLTEIGVARLLDNSPQDINFSVVEKEG